MKNRCVVSKASIERAMLAWRMDRSLAIQVLLSLISDGAGLRLVTVCSVRGADVCRVNRTLTRCG